MASGAGIRAVINQSQWDFPRFDDQSVSLRDAGKQNRKGASRRVKVSLAALVGVVLIGLAVSAAGIVMKSLGSSQVISAEGETRYETPGAISGAQKFVVFVSGAVSSPGLVEVPEGSRVHDALESAGGLSSEAEVVALNLARLLVDGEHLVVPKKGEATESNDSSPGRVSLSLASASELETLSGVGPALAQRIVAWRSAHGPFRHIDDVLAVSGIGPATLEGFRDQVVP